jgi:predicted CopG family antitoxin
MPKPGYKSITVSENVYKKFLKVYEKNKKGLEIKGIRSFSGYLTSMMEETMVRYEIFVNHAPYMEKIDIDQNRVTLKDNKRNRIAEVLLKDGELQCMLDERPDCVHVGFVYSLPELYHLNSTIKGVETCYSFPHNKKFLY